MHHKPSFRQAIRTILSSVSKTEIAEASSSICQYFSGNLRSTKNNPTIAVYSAHGPEIRLDALHSSLPGARLLYPLCHSGGILSFHAVKNIKELTPGMLGILEPDPAKHAEVSIAGIDIFLCPGLAFGRDCTRLGHGGGFYDRALHQRSHNAVTIGVALGVQIRDTVPHADHDIHLDHILTEHGYVV